LFIIWGSTGREIELACGQFYCPQCNGEQAYKHIRVARYFTLYFIPLFQTENLGEYVKCEGCQQAFKEEVLSYEPPSQVQSRLYSIRADLESGIPIQVAQRRLLKAGIDEQLANQAISLAAGEQQKGCSTCYLNYVETVSHCSSCGKPLDTTVWCQSDTNPPPASPSDGSFRAV